MGNRRYVNLPLVALGLVASLVFGCTPRRSLQTDSIERNRRSAFEQHAALSESARVDFDRKYNERLTAGALSPASIAAALGAEDAPVLKRTAGGEYEQTTIEVPTSYSRVIFSWDASGDADGYAWEMLTPAADNVSWAKHMAEQA
jgi:hypothetical protein